VLPSVFGGIFELAAVLQGDTFATTVVPFAASFAALLVPTTLMGGTLPLLSRYVAGYDTARGISIGLLYSLNTVGALTGAALTGFLLLRVLGIETTTFVATAANFAICALGLVLARRWPQRDPPALQPIAVSPQETKQPDLMRAVVCVFFVNGLAGLGLQLLWTRAFALFGTNTTYAFTIILTTYLFGIAAGSGMLSAILTRLKRPVATLALLQVLTGWVAALTPIALSTFGLDLLQAFEAGGGVVLYSLLLASLLMLPATLLMGACFPLVAQVIAGEGGGVGSRVGGAYALNTLGGVGGSLLAGFVPAHHRDRALNPPLRGLAHPLRALPRLPLCRPCRPSAGRTGRRTVPLPCILCVRPLPRDARATSRTPARLLPRGREDHGWSHQQ
jgi:spermidine synthase